MEKFEPTSFEDAIRICVVPIDEHLGELNVPIPDRVLQASLLFVQHNIQGIEGDSKDNFIGKGWFKAIFQTIRSWYEEKYGPAVNKPKPRLIGACKMVGAIFRLEIPITLTRVETPGETAWLVFPVDLQPEEDPKRWFVVQPNFDSLDPIVRERGLDEAVETGRLLRTIHSELMTANRPDDTATELTGKTLTHIANAAEMLTDTHRPMFRLASWEAHQAVESALKLFSRQLTGGHLRHHDLQELFDRVKARAPRVDHQLFNLIPSGRRIVEIRAGEGANVDAEEGYRTYRAALALTAQISFCMPGLVRMQNAAFLLKKAPFI